MTQVLFSTISLFQFASPFEGVQISDFIKRPSAASNIVLREFQGGNPRAEPCALAVEVPDPITREIEDRASHPEISEGRSLDSMDCGELSWRYWITFARIAGETQGYVHSDDTAAAWRSFAATAQQTHRTDRRALGSPWNGLRSSAIFGDQRCGCRHRSSLSSSVVRSKPKPTIAVE